MNYNIKLHISIHIGGSTCFMITLSVSLCHTRSIPATAMAAATAVIRVCVSNDIIFDSIERENRIYLTFEHGADRVRHAE